MRTAPLAAALALVLMAEPVRGETDWKQLEQIFARPASEQPGGIHRFSFPRTDLEVMLDGVRIRTGLALGSWLAFQPAEGDRVVVAGDLVLTDEEVNRVMKRLAEGGVKVTALHNHLMRAEPFPMYMHVEGHGDPVELARTLHEAIALSGTPMAHSGNVGGDPDLDLDTATIARVLGREGKADGGVYKIDIHRAEQITAGGMAMTSPMGTAIAIGFQSAGKGKAATTGDFVLTAEEVNPVLRALRAQGIEVTALHNHMLDEEPRLFFMHFWGVGSPEDLARGLKAALDEVKVR